MMTLKKTVSRSLLLSEDYFIKGIAKVDLTKLLDIGLHLSGDHDSYIQAYFNQGFLEPNQSWVITQYQINLLEEAKLGDYVTVDTRIVEANRFFISRRYSVTRNNKLLYEIYTKFAGIDLIKRSIVRLDLSKYDLDQLVDGNYKVNFDRIRKNSEGLPLEETDIEILPAYIDENNHVNNLVYLNWAYKALEAKLFDKYQITKIAVKYDKEILPQDEVVLLQYGMINENRTTQQIIFNKSQDKISSIINFHWENK